MKKSASKKISSLNIVFQQPESSRIKIKPGMIASTSQKTIKNSKKPLKPEILSSLTSPKAKLLKPIQTLKDLQIKMSQSSRPSPSKMFPPKKKLILLSPDSHNINILKLIEDPSSSKLPKRRTQSMIPALSLIEQTSSKNFVAKCLFKTRVGSLYGKNKKENQDSFIIYPNLEANPAHFLFSVCDGHGVYGHLVSRFLKNHLAEYFEEFLESYKKNNNKGNAVQQAYKSAVKKCEESMNSNKIDVSFSGTTAVSVIIQGDLLTCANIGDSRAVLGKKLKTWYAESLSRDHKPELKDESERILACLGRIMPYFTLDGTPAGPCRVWLQNENIPGLAMSRSVGDMIAATVGVTSDPEFCSTLITNEDKFIIIASDGL